jgi:ATP-dependent Clp protease adaptor protein ClpS
VDAAWLLLLGLSLGGSVLWSGARRRPPSQTPELTIALTVAALDAARRGHALVQPAHLVAAALVGRAPAPPFTNAHLTSARDAVDRLLDGLPAADEPVEPHTVQLSPALMRAVRAAARTATATMHPLGLDHVLDELADDEGNLEIVRAAREPAPASVSPTREGAPYRAPPPEQHAHVVLLNDDVSTMEGVLEILRECFAKAEPEALYLMLTTHYVGQATVARYGWDEANARAARATARARKMGMPLRVTVISSEELTTPPAPVTLAERVRRFFAKVAA